MEVRLELVERAKAADASAFAELYQSVYQDLYRFAFYTLRHPQDAEDVVSETVMDAFRGIGRLREAEAFRGWIFRILSNKCKRRLKAYTKKTVPLDETIPDVPPDMEEGYDTRRAFSELSDEERLILSMSLFGGYTSAEIGKFLHRNENTVRSKQSRALKKLKGLLEV